MKFKSLLESVLGALIFCAVLIIVGVTGAILVARILPINAFLANNARAINAAPGAQFINAVYPVPGSAQAFGIRWSPWLPAMVGISIVRKVVRPLDDVLKRIFPPGAPRTTDTPRVNDLLLPEADQSIIDGLVRGNAGSLAKQPGKLINLSLSVLFLLLVFFCILLLSDLVKRLIYGINTGSKQLIRGGAIMKNEIQAVPVTIKEIYSSPRKVVRKKKIKKSDE